VAAVVFGVLAGALFGAYAVAVRSALERGADARIGAFVVPFVAVMLLVPPAVVAAAVEGVDSGDLWPFALAGVLAPGLSQVFFILAVRDTGPSRAAILIGMVPLISVAIALVVLDEPLRPLLLVGTGLVVGGGIVLARERERPEHFRVVGVAYALLCAVLFAVRDNVVRWAARGTHPPPLVAAAVSLAAATIALGGYLLVTRADVRAHGRLALRAFAPAGVALGVAYAFLLEAFDRGRVSIVAPLNATQSLWAVLIATLLVGRATEMIGRRLVVAGMLVVAGAAFIGAVR
jgi:drug/metabolite transporter (DMT)-like permease